MEVLTRCYATMASGDLTNPGCLKELVTLTLNYGIIAGSVLLQVPLILNILRSKSVAGLSATSLYAGVVIPLTMIVYNYLQGYPPATWAENIFSFVQNAILVGLYWRFSQPALPFSSMVGITAGFVIFTLGCLQLPPEQQSIIPLSALPLLLLSRVPQILANYANKHTGPLSAITFLLVVAGSAARIYTTIVKVGWDMSLLANFGASVVLSAVTAVQIFYYAGNKESKAAKVAQDKKKKQ